MARLSRMTASATSTGAFRLSFLIARFSSTEESSLCKLLAQRAAGVAQRAVVGILEAALGDDTTCLPREMCKALARELWMVDIQLAGCGTNIRQVLVYVEEGTRLHATLTDTDAVTLRTVRLINDFHVSLGR